MSTFLTVYIVLSLIALAEYGVVMLTVLRSPALSFGYKKAIGVGVVTVVMGPAFIMVWSPLLLLHFIGGRK